ncbi:MAG: septum formation initiator family protein [Flavobacteriaceae bacterium]|nr:septum formation initiator family protein [Flavobacteriaceae bacterium]
MTFKQLKETILFRFLTNKYFLIALGFAVWMLFFDQNSYETHRVLNNEIEKLESSEEFYSKEIQQDKKVIEDLKNSKKLEKFAREEYKMKKENEDLFLIEYDTIK